MGIHAGLQEGFRQIAVNRRENGVLSWLGFQAAMPRDELTGMFDALLIGEYKTTMYRLTCLAVENLLGQELIQETEEAGSRVLSLIDPRDGVQQHESLDLTPREEFMLRAVHSRYNQPTSIQSMHTRFETSSETNPRMTEMCLNHLVHLKLMQTVESGLYVLA